MFWSFSYDQYIIIEHNIIKWKIYFDNHSHKFKKKNWSNKLVDKPDKK